MPVSGDSRLSPAWRRRAPALAFGVALIALFAGTALFRFLALGRGFSNDHFLHLAAAQQLLLGEWPTRDFVDPGLPLTYAVSAAAQWLLGRTLLAEGLLVATAFGLAAVLTAAAGRELTGSRALALGAAILQVAIVPRTYGYPKILAYAAGFYLLQRYVSRPTTARLWAYAATVVAAFLFRHDHGIYLGIAGVIATWLTPSGDVTHRLRHTLTFVGMTALIALPYLVYVQVNGGFWAYLQTGLEFRDGELGRQEYIWPDVFGGGQPFRDALVYEYWALPLATLIVLAASRLRGGLTSSRAASPAKVLPIVAVAIVLNATFLRAPLLVRQPDVIVPAVLLGSWLAGVAWRARRSVVWRPVALALGVVFTLSVGAAGQTIDHLARAGLLRSWSRLPDTLDDVGWTLLDPHSDRQMPSRAAQALQPFYPYAIRCSAPHHRLLVAGFVPEALVFAHRPFGGGLPVFVAGYYDSDARQRAIVAKLRQQTVPFLLRPGRAYASDFERGFPIVAEYVRGRYTPMATVGDEETGVRVLVDRTLPVARRDDATGWPCFT